MNLNYAIFRSEPIYTLQDLAQIGSHNKREKKAYNSNPDIKLELSKNNIELVPLAEKYVKGFYNITKEYRKEHEEKMKTTRLDRQKTFNQMLNKSKNVVADELLFTATNTFFEGMDKESIKQWADTCMDFVYKDLGYKKEQVLHATIHMDEKTPHIHCVVIPLVKKYDKRTKTERYTISKKQYIRDKVHLSELQDKYHKRLIDNGFDLERGIKGSDAKHIKIKDYKKITTKLEKRLNIRNEKLNNAITEFEKQTETTKNIPFDKKHMLIEKETFTKMNNVIKETKKIMEIQPKLENAFNEVDTFIVGYKSLQTQNNKYEREIKSLKTRNHNLLEENKTLKTYLKSVLKAIKQFFRQLLQIGNDKTKEATTDEVKEYYDSNDFDKNDVIDIARDTTKENELLNYIGYEKEICYDTQKQDDFDFQL